MWPLPPNCKQWGYLKLHKAFQDCATTQRLQTAAHPLEIPATKRRRTLGGAERIPEKRAHADATHICIFYEWRAECFWPNPESVLMKDCADSLYLLCSLPHCLKDNNRKPFRVVLPGWWHDYRYLVNYRRSRITFCWLIQRAACFSAAFNPSSRMHIQFVHPSSARVFLHHFITNRATHHSLHSLSGKRRGSCYIGLREVEEDK